LASRAATVEPVAIASCEAGRLAARFAESVEFISWIPRLAVWHPVPVFEHWLPPIHTFPVMVLEAVCPPESCVNTAALKFAAEFGEAVLSKVRAGITFRALALIGVPV
jgi:hypothetical protein